MANSVAELSTSDSESVSNASLSTQRSIKGISSDEHSLPRSIAQGVETTAGDNTSSTESSSIPTFPLLELPSEVLIKIFKEVFTTYIEEKKYDELGQLTTRFVLPFAQPKYNLGIGSFEGDRHMPTYTTRAADWKHLGLPDQTLAILTVSRKTYVHACPILYDMYHFRTYYAESFRVLFTKEIGVCNLRDIKALTMGLPHALKTMPSKYLGRYLRMLVLGMPKLKILKCTTQFGRWFYPLTHKPSSTWIESHRGLLWYAAWVTLRHRNLKFAVWDEYNTVSDNKVDTDRAAFYDLRMVELAVTITSTRPQGLQALPDARLLEIENEQLGHGYVPITEPIESFDDEDAPQEETQVHNIYTPTKLHPDAKIVEPATRLLLSSAKIRRTGFFNLATMENCRPYRYQLPPASENSEARAVEGGEYGDPLEAHFLNNKNPELTFHHDRFKDEDVNSIYLRATALENSNVDREMLAKNGPPPPSSSSHGDDDGDTDEGGEGGSNDDDGWQQGPVHHGPASNYDDHYDENDFKDEDQEDYGDLTSHEDDGVGHYEVSHEDLYEYGALTVPAVDSEDSQSSGHDAWAAYAELLERFNAF